MSTSPAARRRSLSLLYAGLAATVLVAAAPLVDLATVDSIADHVRDAYPQWPASDVAADRNAITTYLGAVGALSVAGWAWALALVARGSHRARMACTVLFALGALLSLTGLSYGGGPYHPIVPIGYGLLGLVPVLIGAASVYALWRPVTVPRAWAN